jgi:hypothetical protein
MEEDDILDLRRTTPANDTLARILRWVGLLSAFVLLGWVAVTLTG